jgi:hypothetical protein
MAIEKIKILGAILELPAQQHCQSSPFTSKIGPNGLNWHCCLAGSPQDFDFFNCYGCQIKFLAEIHCYLSALKI